MSHPRRALFGVVGMSVLMLGVWASAQDRAAVPPVGTAQTPPPADGRRVALVVGIDAYPRAPLQNARNDAAALASVLTELGFVVTRIDDATRDRLGIAIASFAKGIGKNDVAMFFFAGHGVQVDGDNYLLPADYSGDSLVSVRVNGIRASEIQQTLSVARVSVLILDACRNNPYANQRTAGTGLAAMEARGTLVAYATGAGQVASDGPAAKNGLFTGVLVEMLRQSDLTLRETFFAVRQRVFEASGGTQFPALYDGLLGDMRLRSGTQSTSSTPSRDLVVVGNAPIRTNLLADPPLLSSTGTVWRSPTDQRLMTRIPNGNFRMGSQIADEWRRDDEMQHEVRIEKPFWVDVAEVTYADYAGFIGRNPEWAKSKIPRPLHDGGYLSDWISDAPPPERLAVPVVFVSWFAAAEYCRAVGKSLPTEAEFEYVARAGSQDRFWWGALFDPTYARMGDSPVPASDSRANLWGVIDSIGNVTEWTSSLYRPYPFRLTDGREDPKAAGVRAVRGGSWRNEARNLRLSARSSFVPTRTADFIGFRCVRRDP